MPGIIVMTSAESDAMGMKSLKELARATWSGAWV